MTLQTIRQRTMIAALLIGGALLAAGTAAVQAAPGTRITDVRLARLGSDCQGSAPVTFGQPLRPGDLAADTHLRVIADDHVLPSQTDIRARNADGSPRHVMITIDAPCDLKSSTQIELQAVPGAPARQDDDQALARLLASDFDAQVELQDGADHWQRTARSLLETIARESRCDPSGRIYCRRWLSGPRVNEWVVGAPPQDSQGQANPQLMIFFAIRAYDDGSGVGRVRVDTAIDNDWAYAASPGNQHYDVTLKLGADTVWQNRDLTHYAHARWHHVAWWKHDGPAWFAALNGAYLQATPAVPRYQSITLDEDMLSRVRQSCAPMDHCDVMDHMEATGAQPQIGPLPQWSSAYAVATNDYRAYRWMLADSDALGAYGIHYRERETNAPLSLTRHPCFTLLGPPGEQARCHAAPHGDDRMPTCHDCDSPIKAEPAHHGAPAYMAYLVTGDWYYAQELSFWADWVVGWQNPAYRDYASGLIQQQQARGQAWALRTLGDAAYALPDDAARKADFNAYVNYNINWYTKRYLDDGRGNALGILADGAAITYPLDGPHRHTGIATWQMSFFNWAMGNLADMGFAGADQLRDYFSTMPVAALNGRGFCPVMASAYNVKVRDAQDAPLYDDYARVYERSFPKLRGIPCDSQALLAALRKDSAYDGFPYPLGTMVGYPKSDTGFVANYQIGAAAAANSNRPGAHAAWQWFMARPVRPSYTHAPQFAVVPSR